MNKRGSQRVTLFCGAFLLIITVLIYAVGCKWPWQLPMLGASFGFIILSELALVVSFCQRQQTVLRFSGTTIATVYMLVTVFLAVLYVNLFPLAFQSYLIINILLLFLSVTSLVCFYAFVRHLEHCEGAVDASRATMDTCAARMRSISVNQSHQAYGKQLNDLYELIRYSDCTDAGRPELVILARIDHLQALLKDNDEQEISRMIEEIRQLVVDRNDQVKQGKR